MYQSLNQKHMLACDGEFVTEKDFEKTCGYVLRLPAIFRLDELANHRNFQHSDQVGHENEAIFQQPKGVNSFALIVGGDLPSHLAHPLLNLLSRDHRAQLLRFRACVHYRVWQSSRGDGPSLANYAVMTLPLESIPLRHLAPAIARGLESH